MIKRNCGNKAGNPVPVRVPMQNMESVSSCSLAEQAI